MKLLSALLLLALSFPAAEPAAPSVYEGHFIWLHDNEKEPLVAVFTPQRDGSYKAEFRFRYGREYIYLGVARGSLDNGRLQGTVRDVRDEAQLRSYLFQGSFQNGVFEGTHSDVSEGGPNPTGTLVLTAKPAAADN